jgi:hypothetical protein
VTALAKIINPFMHLHVVKKDTKALFKLADMSQLKAGLEIARCQWPKAGHILQMAGKNKFEVPKKRQVKFYRYTSFQLLTTTHILDHLVESVD